MNNSEFEKHWHDNRLDEIATTKKKAARSFLKPVIERIKSQKKAYILDAGCGDGVQAEVLSECSLDYKYLGIDIAQSAISSVKKRIKDNRFEFHVADISEMPINNETFDIIFAYGVIAYLNNPLKGIKELSRVAKKGSIVGAWFYPKRKGFLGEVFNLVRWLCSIEKGNFISYAIANFIVPIMGVLPITSGVHLGNATWKQCREVVLVNIKPEILRFPDQEEVFEWFHAAGLEVIEINSKTPLTIWAKK